MKYLFLFEIIKYTDIFFYHPSQEKIRGIEKSYCIIDVLLLPINTIFLFSFFLTIGKFSSLFLRYFYFGSSCKTGRIVFVRKHTKTDSDLCKVKFTIVPKKELNVIFKTIGGKVWED